MSKIEEALKKAKKSRTDKNKNSQLEVRKDEIGDYQLTHSAHDGLNTNVDATRSGEISLMNSGEILDTTDLSKLPVIYSEMHDNKVANNYRDLRTKLIQKSKGKNFIALVTSCGPDSALTSLNISAAFSLDKNKTSLLIDCNLSDPKLDSMLNMDLGLGLVDYLNNEEVEIADIIHGIGIERLKMIPAGTTSLVADEYFTYPKMRNLMSDLLYRYSDRYIFLDSAPIMESADTRILVELCDFVILTVPYATSTKSTISEAAAAVGDEKLLGVVFTDVPVIPKMSLFGTSKL